MLLHRVLSAIIGIPLAIAAIWFGGLYLMVPVALLIILGLREYDNIIAKMSLKFYKSLGFIGGLLIFFVTYYNPSYLMVVITLLLISVLIGTVFSFKQSTFVGLILTVFGTFYVGLFFSYLLLIRDFNNGAILLLYLFLLNWTSDSAAYFVGRAIGRHKLAPKVSPNKTIEGSLGGIIGTVVVSLIFGLIYLELSVQHLVIIGVLISIFGQIGDLAESALKRMANVKDSGNLIPGHGGVLDRFDSILLTAPLLYLYLNFLV